MPIPNFDRFTSLNNLNIKIHGEVNQVIRQFFDADGTKAGIRLPLIKILENSFFSTQDPGRQSEYVPKIVPYYFVFLMSCG